MNSSDIIHEERSGNVVVEIKPIRTKDGTYFWSYYIRREYRTSGETKRAWNFTQDDTESIGTAMSKAIHFMTSTDADNYVEQVMCDAA